MLTSARVTSKKTSYLVLGKKTDAMAMARRWCQRAVRHPAVWFYSHATLASALALLDRREEAKIALDKLHEIKPDFNPDAILAAFSPLNPEALRPQFKTYNDGLRKAGLDIPDEPTAGD